MKDWLSLVRVAWVCRVHVKIVGKWIDEGLLEAFQLPASTHRRVLIPKLREFMAANKLPTDRLAAEVKKLKKGG